MPPTIAKRGVLRSSQNSRDGKHPLIKEDHMLAPKSLDSMRFIFLLSVITILPLSGCDIFRAKPSGIHVVASCPEVDVIDSSGKNHWPCRKTPNGSGGYKCMNGYEGVAGCNSCPTCRCTTVGSGASQDCKCQ